MLLLNATIFWEREASSRFKIKWTIHFRLKVRALQSSEWRLVVLQSVLRNTTLIRIHCVWNRGCWTLHKRQEKRENLTPDFPPAKLPESVGKLVFSGYAIRSGFSLIFLSDRVTASRPFETDVLSLPFNIADIDFTQTREIVPPARWNSRRIEFHFLSAINHSQIPGILGSLGLYWLPSLHRSIVDRPQRRDAIVKTEKWIPFIRVHGLVRAGVAVKRRHVHQ